MPETFDLDALFAGLERDISDVTHSPGAARAVRSARRRRRTTIGTAAAALALVVGGVVAGRGALGHDSAPPADQVIQMGQLPAAAPFHDADFDRVFGGWESGWSYDDSLGANRSSPLYGLSEPRCWNALALADSAHRPGRVSKNGAVVSGDRQSVAFTEWVRWGTGVAHGADEGFDTYVSELEKCPGAERLHTRAWTGGGQAVTWTVPPGHGARGEVYVWIAQAGRGFAIATVGTEQGPLPDDVEARFVDTLMAGLQSPDSGGPGSGSG